MDLAVREVTLRRRALRIVNGDPWAGNPAWVDLSWGGMAADEPTDLQHAIRAAPRPRPDCGCRAHTQLDLLAGPFLG